MWTKIWIYLNLSSTQFLLLVTVSSFSIEIKKGTQLSNKSEILAHDCINGSAYSRELVSLSLVEKRRMMCACQVPSVSNITSLQEFLMDTGKLKTFTHLSVFTPRKRSSWAIYLVVQFAVGSVFFGFQVIRTSSTQPTRRSPLILMLCSSQRSYPWGD